MLLVDCHQIVRSSLRRILDATGTHHIIGEATTVHDAIARTRSLHPDVALLEADLRNESGLSAIEAILIQDRDSKFTSVLDEIFATENIRVIRTAIRTPLANADAERFVQTMRRECLDWLLIAHERHLRRELVEFLDHYHHERPHRGLELRPPHPDPRPDRGRVERRDRLNGLLHKYYRTAA